VAASEQSLRLAVRNIAAYGDTDVFPFPLENHWFHDQEDDVVGLFIKYRAAAITFVMVSQVPGPEHRSTS
jgi:hypothetical protein